MSISTVHGWATARMTGCIRWARRYRPRASAGIVAHRLWRLTAIGAVAGTTLLVQAGALHAAGPAITVDWSSWRWNSGVGQLCVRVGYTPNDANTTNSNRVASIDFGARKYHSADATRVADRYQINAASGNFAISSYTQKNPNSLWCSHPNLEQDTNVDSCPQLSAEEFSVYSIEDCNHSQGLPGQHVRNILYYTTWKEERIPQGSDQHLSGGQDYTSWDSGQTRRGFSLQRHTVHGPKIWIPHGPESVLLEASLKITDQTGTAVTDPGPTEGCARVKWTMSQDRHLANPTQTPTEWFLPTNYRISFRPTGAPRIPLPRQGTFAYVPETVERDRGFYCDTYYWKHARGPYSITIGGANSVNAVNPNLVLQNSHITVWRTAPHNPRPSDTYVVKPGAPQPIGLTAELSTVQLPGPSVVLTWSAGSDEPADAPWGYNVWRRNLDQTGATLEPIASNLHPSQQNGYVAELPGAGRYEFRVQAYNSNFGSVLSEPVVVTVVPPPIEHAVSDELFLHVEDFEDARLSIYGPASISVNVPTEYVHATTADTTSNQCDHDPGEGVICRRLGGDKRGFGFEMPAGSTAKWIDANSYPQCTGVQLCVEKQSGVTATEYSYFPADGSASTQLVYWRGTSTTTGFQDGETFKVFVPASVDADTSFELGFARIQSDNTFAWLDDPAQQDGDTHQTIQVVALRKPINLSVDTLSSQHARLNWEMPSDATQHGFIVQRRAAAVSNPTATDYTQVGPDLAPTKRQVLDRPADTSVTYSYRVGAYFAGGLIGWSSEIEVNIAEGFTVTGTPLAFEDEDRGSRLVFHRGEIVNKLLPEATGGVGSISYSLGDLSALGLTAATDPNPTHNNRLRITGTARPGVMHTTLNAAAATTGFDFIGLTVFVGDTPDAPVNLTASAGVSPREIVLQWEPPPDVGPDEVLGYRIQISANAAATWDPHVDNTGSQATTYTSRLAATGQTRFYRVAAINREGAGYYSAHASARTATSIQLGPPTNLTAESGRQRITLRWDAPVDTGVDVTGYRIERSATGGTATGEWVEVVDDTRSAATTYTHQPLPANQQIHYRVSAITATPETSAPSTVAVAITAPATVPDPPTNPTTEGGIAKITIRWDAPMWDGGLPITGYQVWYRCGTTSTTTACPNEWTILVSHTESTATTFTHNEGYIYLTKGAHGAYSRWYRVAAINDVGISRISTPVEGSTQALASALHAPRRLWALAGNGTTVGMFEPAEPHESGYLPQTYAVQSIAVESTVDCETAEKWADTLPTVNPLHCFTNQNMNQHRSYDWNPQLMQFCLFRDTNVENTKHYCYRADGESSEGPDGRYFGPKTYVVDQLSPKANVPLSPTAADGLVSGLLGRTTSTVNSITLRWGAPEAVAGATVSGYRIERYNFDTGLWTTPTPPPTPMTVDDNGETRWTWTDSNLEPAEQHIYRVFATTADNRDSAPLVLAGLTSIAPPGAPTNLRPGAVQSGRVELLWDVPAENGMPITTYKVQITPDRNDWQTSMVELNTASTAPRYVVQNVVAGETQWYRVKAVNAEGDGPASTALPVLSSAASLPERPLMPEATSTLPNEGEPPAITVRWQPPNSTGGAPLLSYRVEHSATGAPNSWAELTVHTPSPTPPFTYEHAGLTAGQKVYYRVRATNSVGDSMPSVTVAAVAGYGLPTPPTALKAVGGQTDIVLTWIAPTLAGGDTATGYRIEYSLSATGSTNERTIWAELVSDSGSAQPWFVHRNAGTDEVNYRVATISDGGISAPSEAASAQTDSDLPGPPENLTATVINAEVRLRWATPSNTGRSAVIGYRVEYSADLTTGWTQLVANTATPSTVYTDTPTATGPQTTHWYRVYTLNRTGTRLGAPTEPVTAVVTLHVPVAPPTFSVTPDYVAVELRWGDVVDPTAPAVTQYMIEASTVGPTSGWQKLARITDPTVTTYTHDDFAIRQPTYYRVAGENIAGIGRFTRPLRATAWSYGLHADVNNTNTFNRRDALILYYVLSFPEVLGTGPEWTGFPHFRRELLHSLMSDVDFSQVGGGGHIRDRDLRELVTTVRRSTYAWNDTPLDLNADGTFDAEDAILMLYSWDLIDPATNSIDTGSAAAALRKTLLQPFTSNGMEDADRQDIILDTRLLWDRQ